MTSTDQAASNVIPMPASAAAADQAPRTAAGHYVHTGLTGLPLEIQLDEIRTYYRLVIRQGATQCYRAAVLLLALVLFAALSPTPPGWALFALGVTTLHALQCLRHVAHLVRDRRRAVAMVRGASAAMRVQ
ncbi:hypothetical protein [Amycolatopsis sp. NPDC054798]